NRGDLALDERFRSLAARKRNEATLDTLISSWTSTRDAGYLAGLLQDRGLAAVPSMRPEDLFTDAHLNDRAAWVRYEHPVQGERPALRFPCLFSDGACRYEPAPLFGQHNEEIYGELLGLSEGEIAQLAEDGVIS